MTTPKNPAAVALQALRKTQSSIFFMVSLKTLDSNAAVVYS
jgi:hypothetical protein